MNGFMMPAIHELAGSSARVAQIRSLRIFDLDIYYEEVYQPLQSELGVTWAEMRNRKSARKSQVSTVPS